MHTATPHAEVYLQFAKPVIPKATVVFSIDYSKSPMQAIRTVAGEQEERKDLAAGPEGMSQCTWSNGEIFVSDVPNLALLSRATAVAITRPKKKAKAKAKGKAKAFASEETSSSNEESNAVGEEHAEAPEPPIAPAAPAAPELPAAALLPAAADLPAPMAVAPDRPKQEQDALFMEAEWVGSFCRVVNLLAHIQSGCVRLSFLQKMLIHVTTSA